MKKIAVLLTVHNRKDKTLRCLKNISEQEYDRSKYSVEVFLTDDGCTDGTIEEVQLNYPYVNIIKGDGTLYWNRGMVAAWTEAAKSNYDYYLWLNDDTFIYDRTLSRLLESSLVHDNKSIIVGTTSAVDKHDDITYGGWKDGKVILDITVEHKCNTFNGNIVLVPKYVYELLGTNDPYFHHGLGDIDYGLRANENGIDVWQAKGLMGECDRHEHPTIWMDPSQPFKKRRKNFYSPIGNNPFEFFYFRRKHYGYFAACLTFISNYLHFIFPRIWKKSYQVYKKNNL
ncbi:MAG: glycosyltransferase family 2 protein [Alphaproteobacteria bacterium]|nr:glycosyltransferase family 2 protein [Bacteroidales bacterium]MBQ2883401.1 glycosyltransferase family 2 protein [Alphaproteobacteria bacterium]